VLWNLIRNAAEAMPEGGRLAISSARLTEGTPQGGTSGGRNEEEEKLGWVEIAVTDEGVGIPAEMRERIFDPFFTTKREGSGLGLATVHRIVEDHGGSIRLESAVGQGTSIKVRFPRAETAT
jgi:two-component system sensor histidine kinase PilS (NtrC family)